MAHGRVVAVAGIAALSLLMGAVAPASAADPSNTVTLAEGDSPYAAPIALVDASPAGVIYSANQQFLLPAGSSTPQALPGIQSGWRMDGPLLVGWETQNAPDAVTTVHYRTVDGSTSGQRQEEPYTVRTTTSTGWLVEVDDPDTYQTLDYVHVTASNGARTSLGLPANADGCRAVGGPQGVALLCYDDSSSDVVLFYQPTSGGGWERLGDWSTGVDTYDPVFVSNTHVLVGGSAVVSLVPLNGSPVTTFPLPGGISYSNAVAATSTHVGVAAYPPNQGLRLLTAPIAGGSWTPSTYDIDGLASTGSDFVLSRGGSGFTPVGNGGIFTVPSATGTPSALVTSPPRPLRASGLAVAPGRVVWRDDSTITGPLWSRSVTRTGDTLEAGSPSLLREGATGYGLSASGRRTLAYGEDNSLRVTAPGLADIVLADDRADWGGSSAQISGTRALYYPQGATSNVPVIRNLVTGAETTITGARADQNQTRLWGDTVAYLGNDGAVHVRSLTNGMDSVVAPKPPASSCGGNNFHLGVAVWGDHIAWATFLYNASCQQYSTISYRNFRTLGPTTTVTTSAFSPVMTSGYIAFARDQNVTGKDHDDLAAIRLGTSNVIEVGSDLALGYADREGSSLAADGALVAWVDPDRKPKIATLPTYNDPARHLGNPIAPASVSSGSSWAAEWVLTKALSNCVVTIKAGTTTVRQLSCATDNGSALATWDTRNSAGTLVPPGTYTWTLTGSDAGGALRNTDGSTTPITGTVKVIGVPSAPTAPAVTPGSKSLKASWKPPANTGGAPITGYRVQYKKASASTWTNLSASKINVSTRTASISGLIDGTAYQVRVAAVNQSGSGAFSAAASMTAGAPLAPTGLKVTAANKTLKATWQAPAANGTPKITSYRVQYKKATSATWINVGSSKISVALRSATISGLTNGVKYTVRVAALNKNGVGPFSGLASGTPRA